MFLLSFDSDRMKMAMATLSLGIHRGLPGIRVDGSTPLFVGSLLEGKLAQVLGWTGKTRTLSERFFAMLSLLLMARRSPGRLGAELSLTVDVADGSIELAELRKLSPFTGSSSVEIMRRDILNHFRVNSSGNGVFIQSQIGQRGCHESDRLLLTCHPSDIEFEPEADAALMKWLRARLVNGSNVDAPVASLHTQWPIEEAGEIEPAGLSGPFHPHRPVVHEPSFVGRLKEIGVLGQWLRSCPLQDIALLGPHAAGKTSLLRKLLYINRVGSASGRYAPYWPMSEQSLRLIYVNFEEPHMQREQGLLSHMASSLGLPGGSGGSLEHFVAAATNAVTQPTLIMLDHVAIALRTNPLSHDGGLRDNFWDAMRSLVANRTHGRLAFLLSVTEEPIELAHRHHRSSPFFNMLRTLELKPLLEAEARTLLASSPVPVKPVDVDWILTQTECWPLLLQLAGARYIEAAQASAEDIDWKQSLVAELARLKPTIKSSM